MEVPETSLFSQDRNQQYYILEGDVISATFRDFF